MTLPALARDLWVVHQPLSVLGIEIGTRMTIVRYGDAQLLVHSPIRHTPELATSLKDLGTPALVVAPNRFHHLFAGEWLNAYPASKLLVAPGLVTKRPDLRPVEVLAAATPPGWPEGIEHVLLEGFPFANEVVLFHRASATLVASDLIFNFGPSSPPLARLAFRLAGAYGRPSSSLLERLLIRDRPAFRRSLERVLDWPFERIVIAHGDIVEHDAQRALKEAYSWILGAR